LTRWPLGVITRVGVDGTENAVVLNTIVKASIYSRFSDSFSLSHVRDPSARSNRGVLCWLRRQRRHGDRRGECGGETLVKLTSSGRGRSGIRGRESRRVVQLSGAGSGSSNILDRWAATQRQDQCSRRKCTRCEACQRQRLKAVHFEKAVSKR